MDRLPELMDRLSGDVVPMLIVFAGITLAIPAIQRIRHAWHERRLRRRFAEQGNLMVEEYREYISAMGEEPQPPDPRKLASGLVQAVFFLSIPAIVLTYDLPNWTEMLGAALMMGAAGLWALWRWLNDPPSDQPHGPFADDRSIIVPDEALTGFAAAAIVIMLFGLFIAFVV